MAKQSDPQRELNIYLLREQVQTPKQALRQIGRLRQFPINAGGSSIGTLFVKPSKSHPPRWAAFFEGHIDLAQLGRNTSTSAVLLLAVAERLMAITFGQGRSLLMSDSWEERFGIRVALNSIAPDQIRSLDKSTFDAISTHHRIQASRAGSAPDFGIDVEQDLVRAVTGEPIDVSLGKRLSGMDALHAVGHVNLKSLRPLLRKFVEKSNDTSYKKTFPWIDHIAEVVDKKLIEKLNKQLVTVVNTTRKNCWLAVPEIIEWEMTAGFRYSFKVNAAEYPDINLAGFLESISGKVTLPLLRARHVHRINNDGNEIGRWVIYRCIYCEVEQGGHTYILSAGRWYKIETEFVKLVNEFFSNLSPYEGVLVEYSDASEGVYCDRTATAEPTRFALMDQKPIQIGGAYGKVEFCDLFTKSKDLIHVKRYAASSVLSHLFAQGTVSAEAFRLDESFREQVLAKLPASHRVFTKESVPSSAEYRVVFAVVSGKDGPLTLPFFSRVNIRHACKRLDALGFRTALAKIDVADEMKKKKKYAPH